MKQVRQVGRTLTREQFLSSSAGAGIGLFVLAGCGGAGSPPNQEDYPDQDISLIIQAPPGGTSDLTSRTAANIVEKELGTNIIPENRTGGGGAVGFSYAASQPPDGYTVAYLSVEIVLFQYVGQSDVKPGDFDLIGQANVAPSALTVRADSPYETFEDFVTAAKKESGALKVGGSPPGTIWDIATAAIEQAAEIELEPVPFDGGAPAVAALLGGNVDAVSVGAGEVLANVESGELRVLAVLHDERVPQYPDVSTARELGYDIEIASWGGFGVPTGTPKPVMDTLVKAFEATVRSEKFETTLSKAGILPLYRGPEEFTEYVQSESEKFEEITANLRS